MILKCVSSTTFPADTSISGMIQQCAQAGLDGLQLVLSDQGILNLDSPRADYDEARQQCGECGVRIAALTSDLYDEHHFASPNEGSRSAAGEITLGLIERAAWLGAAVVQVRAAAVGPAESEQAFVSYESAMDRAFEGLLGVIEQAERFGVQIAIRAASGNFLLSPLETRQFIDRLNTSVAGVAIDLRDANRYGYAADWLRILGYRLECLSLGAAEAAGNQRHDVAAGERDVRPVEIARVLSEIAYDGPLICGGRDDLREVAEVLKPFTMLA